MVKQPGYSEKGELQRSCADGNGSVETVRIYASKGLSYTEEDGKIYVSGIGSFKGDFLYISSKTPVLPSSYNGIPVTALERGVFRVNSGVTEITIPESISTVLAKALTSCDSLEEIH